MKFTNGKKELIFEIEKAPFPACHASNLCCLADGSLLAAWFAGEKEGSDDVSIWTARRIDGRWEDPVLTARDAEAPHWNPVIYQRDDGVILLFYKVGKSIKKWSTHVRTSRDNGATWSDCRELVPGDISRGPVRCKVLTLSNGAMLAGTSTEDGIWKSYADSSCDGGETWNLSGAITISAPYHGGNTAPDSGIQVSDQSFYGRGIIQPTLWESEPGTVHMLLRSSEGSIYRADSRDYGKTWSDAYQTALPNNNSGIDVAKCADGTLVLCSNPVAENWGPRTPLTLQISADNGQTWTESAVLEDIPGEYSYPCVVCSGTKLYVTYTYDRKSIAFWEFDLEQ